MSSSGKIWQKTREPLERDFKSSYSRAETTGATPGGSTVKSAVTGTFTARRWRSLASQYAVLFAALCLLLLATVFQIVTGPHAAGSAIALLFVAWISRKKPKRKLGGKKAPKQPKILAISGLVAAVDAMSDPCFVSGTKGQVVHANAAARSRFGRIDVGDPVSFKLRVPTFLEALERVNAGGPQELIGWSEKVPTERWFQAFLSPIRLDRMNRIETGIRPDYTLILVRDLTEQNRLERMRADFVANASHELRTPLASLRGFIETLQGPAKDDAKAHEQFLALMHDQATRMKRLIDDLLSLSRIEMTSHLLPTERVELGGLVEQVRRGLGQQIKEAKIRLKVSIPDEHLIILGDHDELVQVAQNLIENAVKYAADGKQVDVRLVLDKATGDVLLSVQDYGPGIAAEHVPRLTERFYRVDQEASRKAHGTGLGLAIVKHILTKHGTSLNVDSEPGVGSTFSVRFAPAPIDFDRSVKGSRQQDAIAQQDAN